MSPNRIEKVNMAPLPTMALARRIVKNYELDDFNVIIVTGNLRKGKSSYAMKAIEQALTYIYPRRYKNSEMTYSDYTRVMGWETGEVVDTWLGLTEREPAFIWDDAGYWLHSMNWNDPLMISIQQYFNVVGTDYNTIILTSPSARWVLSKIANMPEMIRINVVKRDGGKRDSESRRFSRQAKAYQKWESPDLKRGGVNKIWIDNYSCKIRDSVYAEYKPVRDHYARMAKLQIAKNLRNKIDRDELDELKVQRRLKNLRKELYGETIDEKVESASHG